MFVKSRLFTSIWQQNRWKISLVYLLNILEETCYTFVPVAVGLLINRLAYGQGYGILAFTATYLGWHFFATIRRILDTVYFTRVYNEASLQIIYHHKMQSKEVSTINARIELLKNAVNFFEVDLPFLFKSLVAVFGAAFLLYFYNPVLLLVCFVVIVPSFVINYFFGRKMKRVAQKVNNAYEHQIEVLEKDDPALIKTYFERTRRFNIRKSSLEALNFASLEFFVFLMILISVYVVCQTPDINYGDIVATYGIILRFAYGFDFIPHITERLATLNDIQERLDGVY